VPDDVTHHDRLDLALALSFTTFLIATAVKKYGEAAIKRTGIEDIDKKYAEFAFGRSVDLQKMLIDTGFGSPPGPASVVSLPLGATLDAFPQGKSAAVIYEIGTNGIEIAALYGDLRIANAETYGEIATLENAMKTVSQRVTSVRREAFLRIKGEIDKECAKSK
jgi:hypothetical protein